MYKIMKLLCVLFLAAGAWAQLPHEVLLLVNQNSQDSVKVANVYASVRGIPKRNMVFLDIPESAYQKTATVSPSEFTDLIWKPANAKAEAQGIDGQIMAWVYSVDFPIRVKTSANDRQQMSVCGLTFTRNKVPAPELIEEGTFLSKLFSGPHQRLKLNLPALSLHYFKHGLGETATVPPEAAYLQYGLRQRMPLPNMMLGYTGEKGNDVATVIETIGRGARSDHRGMRSGIYFVMSDDVRSKCREHQFYPAVQELQKMQISATVATNFPAGRKNIMGILMGAENVDPSKVGSFAPGAVAEHLTSWSAEFQKPQTKMTEWIKAGATGSAGAVVEPYSNPNKFPSARFYVQYASGCTMLESFYQSIACPLQTLLLGDPLAKPYAVPVSVKVLGADTIKSDFTFLAQAECVVQNAAFTYEFLLDGKQIREPADDNSVYVRTLDLADGYHELRAVVRIKHTVQFGSMAVKPIMVEKRGRSVTFQPKIERLAKHEHGLKVTIGGQEMPEKIRLVSGLRVLDEKVYADGVELVLDELAIGEGPNTIRAIGVYADGMEVSSTPLSFGITFSKDD
jgi:hypothetical protein